MRVSVVVPTYKRPESLARCLDALDRQERPADETIVVVRSEDAASQEVLRTRAKPVRLVPVERSGVVAAMNAGIDASTGSVVALTDDDSAPHPDWLRRIVEAYASDQRVAAVGGRDWIYKQGQLKDGSELVVGTISRFGHVTGNHHLGVGPPRDVDILKGVNLSVRGDLLRHVRIDERLRGIGTEHHWELALCLTLRRLGFRVIYDPRIAVDHYPQPRVDDSRKFSSQELCDAVHNKTVAVLEHLPAWRRSMYIAWAFAIGTSSAPGVAQMLRSLPSRGGGGWPLFCGAQWGLMLGMRTYWRSRRAACSGEAT
jgi:glycosyltransferase involved in cell wall biosynthesis